MKMRRLSLLLGASLFSLAIGPAGALAKSVSVRVEGETHTLVKRSLITLGTGSVSKDGNPAHSCPAGSAAGALEEATNGSWSGPWSDFGYFVSTIRGETHSGSPDSYSFWIDDKLAKTGICQTLPKDGDELLFFVDRCVFDAAAGVCSNDPVLPLELRLAAHQSKDGTAQLTVVAYSAAGKAKPVAKASIVRDGVWLGKTDSHGHFRVHLRRNRTVSYKAIKRGFARSEAVRATLGR
jgi:hypothetical protein